MLSSNLHRSLGSSGDSVALNGGSGYGTMLGQQQQSGELSQEALEFELELADSYFNSFSLADRVSVCGLLLVVAVIAVIAAIVFIATASILQAYCWSITSLIFCCYISIFLSNPLFCVIFVVDWFACRPIVSCPGLSIVNNVNRNKS
jgi:ABC-type amino acid transport system permease subunit